MNTYHGMYANPVVNAGNASALASEMSVIIAARRRTTPTGIAPAIRNVRIYSFVPVFTVAHF
jgi:hypothetical protein